MEFYEVEDKIGGITVDNVAANTTFMTEFKQILSGKNVAFDSEDQHFRCFPHIINLGVQDLLKLINSQSNFIMDNQLGSMDIEEEEDSDHEQSVDLDDSQFSQIISNIRNTFIKLRRVESLRNQLQVFCQMSAEKYQKPTLDVKTRWNSTYKLLQKAFDMKKSLNLIWNAKEIEKYKITNDDWNILAKLLPLLDIADEISTLLCSEKSPTLPDAVILFNSLVDQMEETMEKLKKSKKKHEIALAHALQAGRDKLLKHYRLSNWVYCVSLILDPRHKYDCFDNSSWGESIKHESIKKFEYLFQCRYFVSPEDDTNKSTVDDKKKNLLFSILSRSKKKPSWKEEVSRYLNMPYPEVNCNILTWWKENSLMLPNLARMARDILAIPASSVSVERFFSSGSNIMSDKRTSLKDETFKFLMLINSWSKCLLAKVICDCPILDC